MIDWPPVRTPHSTSCRRPSCRPTAAGTQHIWMFGCCPAWAAAIRTWGSRSRTCSRGTGCKPCAGCLARTSAGCLSWRASPASGCCRPQLPAGCARPCSMPKLDTLLTGRAISQEVEVRILRLHTVQHAAWPPCLNAACRGRVRRPMRKGVSRQVHGRSTTSEPA